MLPVHRQARTKMVSSMLDLLAGLNQVSLKRVSSALDVLAGLGYVSPKRFSATVDVLAGLSQASLKRVSTVLDVLAGFSQASPKRLAIGVGGAGRPQSGESQEGLNGLGCVARAQSAQETLDGAGSASA